MSHLAAPGIEPAWLSVVKKQVKNLHLGVVQIVVHDRQVVQIELTERIRLKPLPTSEPPAKGGA